MRRDNRTMLVRFQRSQPPSEDYAKDSSQACCCLLIIGQGLMKSCHFGLHAQEDLYRDLWDDHGTHCPIHQIFNSWWINCVSMMHAPILCQGRITTKGCGWHTFRLWPTTGGRGHHRICPSYICTYTTHYSVSQATSKVQSFIRKLYAMINLLLFCIFFFIYIYRQYLRCLISSNSPLPPHN